MYGWCAALCLLTIVLIQASYKADNVKPLPPGTAEKKKTEGSKGGVRKAEPSQVGDSIKKPGHPPHRRTRGKLRCIILHRTLEAFFIYHMHSTYDVKPYRYHMHSTDDKEPSQSTAPHKKKPESISLDRSKNGVPLADSMKRPHQPPHEAIGMQKGIFNQ